MGPDTSSRVNDMVGEEITKRLAKNNGISNYSVTYSQNLKLLNLLKQGIHNN